MRYARDALTLTAARANERGDYLAHAELAQGRYTGNKEVAF